MCFAVEVPCHYHCRQPMSREVKSHVISAARLLIEHGRHSTHHALMSRERSTWREDGLLSVAGARGLS